MSTSWPEGAGGRDVPDGAATAASYAAADPVVTNTPQASTYAPPDPDFGDSHLESSREKAERASLGDLIGDISQGLSTLMRQEVELAKAEVRESASHASKAAGMFGGAAFAGWMAALFLSLAVWEWLSSALDSRGWAAVIVMVVWAIVGAVLFSMGRRATKEIQGLPRTAETAKRVPDALKGNEETR